MEITNTAPSLDLDQMINQLTEQISRGEAEDQRVQKARIRTHSERIQDKRQERIDNLKEQMRSASQGGCLGFLRNIVKVFDLLLKPISALSAGQLKLELGKALERLQKAKAQKLLFGRRIHGKELGLALENLKKFLQEDLQSSRETEKIHQAQEEQLLKMLEELHQGLVSTHSV